MLTLKARVEKGKLVINQPAHFLPERSQILLTFTRLGVPQPDQQAPAEDFLTLRVHERKPATGSITIVHKNQTHRFPLHDYSTGGLSFIAHADFQPEGVLHAGITDPFDPDTVLLELALDVRGLHPQGQGVKIGCQFVEEHDEDLWHGLQMFWG